MKNSILITITTLKGSKQYTITQLIKKFIIILIIFIFLFILTTFFIIVYLNKLVDKKNIEINLKKEELKGKNREIKSVLVEQKQLKIKIMKLKTEIEKKEKFLNEVNDKIEDIERILQFTPPKKMGKSEKLDLAKLDLVDKKFVLDNIPNGYPVKFKGISSKFGWRKHPILHKKEFHTGIDLRASINTPVYATANGIVEFAKYHKRSGYGKLLIIDHNFGFKTLFGHLNKIVVKNGDFVRKGDIVAYTGNTGLSNGPHLHYEVRYIGVILNPINFIKWNLKNYNLIFKKERKVKWQSLIKAIKWQKEVVQQQ